jgi:integrase
MLRGSLTGLRIGRKKYKPAGIRYFKWRASMGGKPNEAFLSEISELRQVIQPQLQISEIQNMTPEELLSLQMSLQLGAEWGVLTFPIAWMPHGSCRAKKHRIVDIRKWASFATGESDAQSAITVMTRYVLLLFFVQSTGWRSGPRYLAPTTIAVIARRVCYIMKFALSVPTTVRSKIFGRLHLTSNAKSLRGVNQVTEFRRMVDLAHRGYWSDVPVFESNDGAGESCGKGSVSAGESADEGAGVDDSPDNRKREHVDDSANLRKRGAQDDGPAPFLPFTDEFVSELGWRAAWLIDELGCALIRCLDGLKMVLATRGGIEADVSEMKRRSRLAKTFLSTFIWTDANGRRLEHLPFELSFRGKGNRAEFSWPPRNLGQVKVLTGLLQTSHFASFFLSSGGRASEALSLRTRNVIRCTTEGAFADGRTFKLVYANEGAERDWPIPDLVARALVQQKELRARCDAINLRGGTARISDEEDNLWAQIGNGRPLTSSYNDHLEALVDALGLTDKLGDAGMHSHRFRKTIARLVALAVVGAPKILMDLFGHETIEMTLHYILTDPLIRMEMELVAKAQIIMLAKEAIKEVEAAGGPAALKICRVAVEERVRLGRDFDEDELTRLAETFTLSGTHWLLVRPGVLCTKLPQDSGPCSQSRGAPEPSRCRSQCSHRFEMAALREDVDLAISDSIANYKVCSENDDPIGAEMWAGQIVANLGRFPDLLAKWSVHPVVEEISTASNGAIT